ncbi:unnamed protein product, partial [Didymodactylos carnosus]
PDERSPPFSMRRPDRRIPWSIRQPANSFSNGRRSPTDDANEPNFRFTDLKEQSSRSNNNEKPLNLENYVTV